MNLTTDDAAETFATTDDEDAVTRGVAFSVLGQAREMSTSRTVTSANIAKTTAIQRSTALGQRNALLALRAPSGL